MYYVNNGDPLCS